MSLSAVVITGNEEDNLKECLASLGFCDEVIVVDDNSTDRSVQIAREFGAKVFERALNADFAAQRNFALSLSKGEWVLFVDADERVSESLASEISKIKNTALPAGRQKPRFSGYYIKRQDNIWGKWLRHGEFGSIKLLRLARAGSGKWQRRIHEEWKITGNVGQLKNCLLHYPHRTLREFISDVNWMSSLHAEENFKEGKRSNVLKIHFWPKVKFFNNWVLRLGLLDGTAGFIAALMMSFHSFLAWSKLWKLQREQK